MVPSHFENRHGILKARLKASRCSLWNAQAFLALLFRSAKLAGSGEGGHPMGKAAAWLPHSKFLCFDVPLEMDLWRHNEPRVIFIEQARGNQCTGSHFFVKEKSHRNLQKNR
jgi:hypothetical protein